MTAKFKASRTVFAEIDTAVTEFATLFTVTAKVDFAAAVALKVSP